LHAEDLPDVRRPPGRHRGRGCSAIAVVDDPKHGDEREAPVRLIMLAGASARLARMHITPREYRAYKEDPGEPRSSCLLTCC
jgi:hypothetical protein